MSLKNLLTKFEEYLPKIDIKIKNEDFRNLDVTSKNLVDLKSILSSMNKIVNCFFKLIKLEDIDRELLTISSEKQKEFTSKVFHSISLIID
jgi:hypothetical protein